MLIILMLMVIGRHRWHLGLLSVVDRGGRGRKELTLAEAETLRITVMWRILTMSSLEGKIAATRVVIVRKKKKKRKTRQKTRPVKQQALSLAGPTACDAVVSACETSASSTMSQVSQT